MNEGTMMKRVIQRFMAGGFACLFLLQADCRAMAAEPPVEPILRIETGMHTSSINRIGADAAGRRLVTASDDGTVRVWELPSGRLEGVIRPPAGKGKEGELYAVAISPDGRTVACGGWTQFNDGKTTVASDGFSIYLFDIATGRLVLRLTGFPNVICHLVFSRDGRFLAAGLGSEGIRVFRTADGTEIASDKNYGKNNCYSADFDGRGRLVTTCRDGFIRLYDQGFRRIAEAKAPGGNNPYSARFSPDGERIAVGFTDSTGIALLSGRDLSFLAAPDTAGADNGNLGGVGWSADGGYLYAGGRYDKEEHNLIRRWSRAGRGSYEDLRTGAMNTIMDLASLPDGSIAFGSTDPAFGIVSPSGHVTLFAGPDIANYRNNQKGFLVSSDGGTIQFGYEYGGKSPGRFKVRNRPYDTDADGTGSLAPPRTAAPGLTVTDWKDRYDPKLNGRPLRLKMREHSRSLAIAPDGESFLLGTAMYLHGFDRAGEERWRIPVPGTPWAVNVAGNGKVAVAAFGDGTIRWYRMTDGQELLALFPLKDRKRWVMWTPGGYYDASPGAEELIGWHLNRGKDQAADFFPASRFRSIYYRPDVIAGILETREEKEALRLADEASGRRQQKPAIDKILPPVVTILSPSDGTVVSSPDVTVSCDVRSPSGEPVTAIRVLVDGRPVSTQRGIAVKAGDGSTQTIRVTVPERDAEISLIAENRFAASVPSTIRLLWRGREEFVAKPKLYILAVGVSDYEDRGLALGFAAKDARDFAGSMERQKGGLYRDVTVRVLTDRLATRDVIMDGLDWIQRETTSKDVAMVFLAGHGVNDQAGIYYYLPANANTDRLKRTGVSFSDIRNTVASLAGKALLFVDTCHSGDVMGTRRGSTDITAMVNELASAENGVVVFASSTGRQYSMEDASWGNGAFTKALVEGMNGRADYLGKGRVTINMLDLYLSERVKELTGGKQTPTTTKPRTIPDFPVAMKQ
jgi:WD40 repeat protein